MNTGFTNVERNQFTLSASGTLRIGGYESFQDFNASVMVTVDKRCNNSNHVFRLEFQRDIANKLLLML